MDVYCQSADQDLGDAASIKEAHDASWIERARHLAFGRYHSLRLAKPHDGVRGLHGSVEALARRES
jgi:hypothetical protein